MINNLRKHKMTSIINPFLLNAYEAPQYFCGREAETQRLTEHLLNGRNVVLAAPRRLGKTELIQHLMHQPVIRDAYYPLYVDLSATDSVRLMVFQVAGGVLQMIEKEGLDINPFIQTVRSLRLTAAEESGKLKAGVNLGAIGDSWETIFEIFLYLKQLDHPVMVAMDEFQQVMKYKCSTVEAEVKGLIDFVPNGRFIFSGSEVQLLTSLFTDPERPLYKSAVCEGFNVIERTIYRQFAQRLFAEGGRTLPDETFDRIYDRVDGVTYCVQYLLHLLYDRTQEGKAATPEDIEPVMKEAVALNSVFFTDQMAQLSTNQQAVLLAVAAENTATAPTSADFVHRYSLRSASIVQTALRSLTERSVVERMSAGYRVSDCLFEAWLRMNYSSSFVAGR